MTRIKSGPATLLALLAALAGCASTPVNVRALREFQSHDVTPERLTRHLNRVQESLDLIDRLLNQTPYVPGSPMFAELPLDNAAAERTATALGGGDQAEVLDLYVTHVRAVVDRAAQQFQAASELSTRAKARAQAATEAAAAAEAHAQREAALAASEAARAAEGVTGAEPVPDSQAPKRAAEAARLAAQARAEAISAQAAAAATEAPVSLVTALSRYYPVGGGLQKLLARRAALRPQLKRAQEALDAQRSQAPALLGQQTREAAEVDRLRDELEAIEDELGKKPDLTALRNDPVARQVLHDAMVTTSMALRLAAEAAATASVAAAEAAARVLRGKSDPVTAPKLAVLGMDLPRRASRLSDSLESDAAVLKALVETLARVSSLELEQTPGFLYDESLVDEIAGITWRSVHAEVQGGGEVLFYTAIEDDEKSSNDQASYDLTGRTQKLEYEVEPIVLAAARASLKLDWIRLPEAGRLNLGFATNRVYKSGGEFETTTLSRELGVEGAASDALDAALAIAGVTASARIAHFSSGKVRLINVADGSVADEAPFTFSFKEVNLGYDFAPSIDLPLSTLTASFRYFDYALPRVLYELENVTPDAEKATFVFSRQSPTQTITSRYFMLGVLVRTEQPLFPSAVVAGSVNLAGGAGPTSYYFLREGTVQNVEANRERERPWSVGATVGGALSFRFRLVGRANHASAFLDASYKAQLISTQLNSAKEDTRNVNSGTTDVFHGPSLSFGGTL
jgi:hypothetical protein